MKAELQQLITLQNTDTEIRRLEAELDSIPQRRAAIEQEFEQRAVEFRALETRRDEARASRVRLETELAETRTQAERAERNLMAAKGEKDYGAAIREIDAARKHASQLETQVLEQMEAFEGAEKEILERDPEITRLRAEKDEKLRAFDEQTRAQAEQLAAARTRREQLLAELPKQTGALYKRISARIRGGVAVAEARNGSCTACFMALRPQVMAEVRRGEEIVICDNCSRILYYAPSQQGQKAPSLTAP